MKLSQRMAGVMNEAEAMTQKFHSTIIKVLTLTFQVESNRFHGLHTEPRFSPYAKSPAVLQGSKVNSDSAHYIPIQPRQVGDSSL